MRLTGPIAACLAVLAAVGPAGCATGEGPPPGAAPVTAASAAQVTRVCDLVAAPGGSDTASGRPTAPLGTFEALEDRLERGQTGCLREGVFEAPQTTITVPDVTLRSYPGESATIRGRLWVDARDVKVLDLILDSSTVSVGATSPTVTAPDVVFRGNEVTNLHLAGICFGLGSDEGYGPAVRTVIEGNRIHDCGRLPPTNHDHGIYAAYARDVVIRNNVIYGNADRGVQLYPDADRTSVTGNVIDANGEGVIISGDRVSTSDENLVEGNLITGSVTRWNVESSWVDGLIGSGNLVRRNCLFSTSETYDVEGGISPAREGFMALENLLAEPGYADPDGGSFVLPAEDPCRAVVAAGSPALGESPVNP